MRRTLSKNQFSVGVNGASYPIYYPLPSLPSLARVGATTEFWKFRPTRPFDKSIPEAIDIALNKKWQLGQSVRDGLIGVNRPVENLRCLVVASYVTADAFSSEPTKVDTDPVTGETVFSIGERTMAQFYNMPDRFAIGYIFNKVWTTFAKILLSKHPDITANDPKHAYVDNGGPAVDMDKVVVTPPNAATAGYPYNNVKVGFGWPAAAVGIAIVAGVVIIHALDIYHEEVVMDDANMDFLIAHAQAMELLKQHRDAEEKANRLIPLNEIEKSVLRGLDLRTDEAIKRKGLVAEPTPDIVSGAIKETSKLGIGLGKSAVDLGTVLAIGAVAGLGIYLFSSVSLNRASQMRYVTRTRDEEAQQVHRALPLMSKPQSLPSGGGSAHSHHSGGSSFEEFPPE